MPGVADGLGVVGPGAAPFHGRREKRGVRGQGRVEVEGRELVVTQDRRALGAVDADLRREARGRPAGRRAREGRARPVGELDPAGGHVLDLHALVRHQPRRGGDAAHRTHQPEQQVDGVDALVHERAAAVEGERAAPGRGIVVGLRAPPGDERARHRQAAEASCGQRRLERHRAGAEAPGQDARERDARLGAGRDERVATGQRDLEGLLHHDVLAGLGAGRGRPEMVAARRAEADHVHVGPGEHRLGRRLGGAAVLRGELLRLGRGAVADRDEADAGDLGEGAGVELGDHAGAPDGESKRLLAHGVTPLSPRA